MALIALALIANGCGGGGGGGVSDTDTDADAGDTGSGLTEPADFLALPGVEAAIAAVEAAGSLTLVLSTDTSPPNIEGTYIATGDDFYPEVITYDEPDVAIISAQTSDNLIHVALYGESDEFTVTYVAEIIRGSGNQFTIYVDALVEEIDGYNSESVFIIDGTVDADGNIEAVMVEALTNFTPELCSFDSDPNSSYGSYLFLEKL